MPRQRRPGTGPASSATDRLRPDADPADLGVAHRTLPCGSKVVLRYRGGYVRTTVIDRGPFANGAKWDLTQATAGALGFEYTDEVRVAEINR